MPWRQQKGARIYYEAWGVSENPEGQWATLVNGYSRTCLDFRMLGRELVRNGYRVLVLDNRGVGKTETSSPFSLNEMTDDIGGLWEALEIRRSHLLGISLGGIIASRTALRFREKVSSLILVSTAADARWLKLESLADLTLEDREAALLRYVAPQSKERLGAMLRAMAKEVTANPASVGQRQAIAGVDLRSELPHLRGKTLVIHGAADEIIPADAARELAALIPHARLEIDPSVGHLFLIESPKRFYEKIIQFLGEANEEKNE